MSIPGKLDTKITIIVQAKCQVEFKQNSAKARKRFIDYKNVMANLDLLFSSQLSLKLKNIIEMVNKETFLQL